MISPSYGKKNVNPLVVQRFKERLANMKSKSYGFQKR